MKYGCLVLALFVAAVSCQGPSGPPPPPPSGASSSQQGGPPQPSPVVTLTSPAKQPSAMPAMSQPPAQPSASGVPVPITEYRTSQRPQGCSPGCYSDEICAEMGRSYCRQGGRCNVCIKMKSIRFPASALSGIISQPAVPQVAPVSPPVVAPPVPVAQPAQQQQQQGFEYSTPTQSSNAFNWMRQTYNPSPFSYFSQPASQPINNNPFASLFTSSQQTRQAQRQPASYYSYQPQQQSLSPAFPFLFFGDFGFGF